MDSARKKIILTKRLHKIPKITAWMFPRRIWFGTAEKVYLTFDDGPHPEITPWLLDFLKEKNIKATFFWLGENIEKHPEFVEQAQKEGHIVAYHGYKHISNTQLSDQAFKDNLRLPYPEFTYTFYRPPYGRITRRQAKYIQNHATLTMWSWMSYDFDADLTVEDIQSRAEKDIQGGEVLIYHENDKTVGRLPLLLPKLVQQMEEKSLQFELLSASLL